MVNEYFHSMRYDIPRSAQYTDCPTTALKAVHGSSQSHPLDDGSEFSRWLLDLPHTSVAESAKELWLWVDRKWNELSEYTAIGKTLQTSIHRPGQSAMSAGLVTTA